eukprot:4146224-Lingulodinium_polyedra.AAC.1
MQREVRGRFRVELSLSEREALVRFAEAEAKSPGVLAPALVRKVAWHFGVGGKTVMKYLLASQEKAAQED